MSDVSEKTMIVAPFKSSLAAILLSLVLGPIGLLYINWMHSIIMLIISFILLALPVHKEVLLALFSLVWLISIYWAAIDVLRFNNKLMNRLVK